MLPNFILCNLFPTKVFILYFFLLDLTAVVYDVGELEQRGNKYLKEVTLLDHSEHLIACVLWDNIAVEASDGLQKGSIMAVKGAKVSKNDYHGVSLNISDGALFYTDKLDISESSSLKSW